jgi:hypothetical protein
MELLDKLPVGHPSREALTSHLEELVAKLIRRERGQAQPFREAGVSFGFAATIGGFFLLGGLLAAAEAVGIYTLEPEAPGEAWTQVAISPVIVTVYAWFAFRAWRRGNQAHEATDDSWIAPAVEETRSARPQSS